METIGDYQFPTRGTFQEALDVANEAITKYAGVVPAKAAGEKLGFTIKDGSKIGSPVYAKFNDLATYGLFTKERGGYKTTDTAVKALDPNDSAKAAEGKAEALRKMPILQKLWSELRGDIPQETALPAKLSSILNERRGHAIMHLGLFAKVVYLLVELPHSFSPHSSSPRR